jgi:hypothetical protein
MGTFYFMLMTLADHLNQEAKLTIRFSELFMAYILFLLIDLWR